MNIIAGWKRNFFFIVIFFVILRIGFIVFRGEINKEYYKSASYDLSGAEEISCQDISEVFECKEDRLNSLEIIFNNIAEDKKGAITLWIWKGDKLIYQT